MKHLVISDNTYIKISLDYLLERDTFDFNICIVDLNSCKSLEHLKSVLSLAGVDRSYRILFLFGRGVYSKLLSKFVGVKLTSNLSQIYRVIKSRPLHTYDEINAYISMVKKLNCFHPKEIFCISMFVVIGMNETCNLSKLSSKVIYRVVLNSANKLNFSRSMSLAYFMRTEFSIDELKYFASQYSINYINLD